MKKKFLSIALFTFVALSTTPIRSETKLFDSPQEQHIVVNNRILAKVNGKAISVIDLMKKMDMLFYRQYPQYTASVAARYQFYQANWKSTLTEMIDKELILIDAEEMKVTVSPGDVRQEMETMFGPNIILNLDKVGLTFDEAYKMVLDEITIRRMLHFRVQLGVINEVTPQKIRTFYDDIAKDNIRDNEWVYNVITIKDKDTAKAGETANLIYHMLTDDKVPLTSINEKLEDLKITPAKLKNISISEEYKTNEKELSEVYKQTLVTLSPDSYSHPIAQKSRAHNTSVFRIFYLKSMTPGGVIPYNELEGKIRNKLINDGMDKETDCYFKKQRHHFDIQEAQIQEIISSDFQPFMLK